MKPFSVIIPTCGRPESLRAVLDVVGRQAEAVEETLVVFDGAEADEGLAAQFPGVRVLQTGGRRGPAAARNAGARQARADTLVFVDDDVVPEDAALAVLAGNVSREPRTAFACRVIPDPSVPDNAYARFAYAGVAHSRPRGDEPDLYRHFCTSFASVPRDAFLDVGGFDERFDRPGYEDVELAFRLGRAGTALRFCGEAAGRHLRRMDRAWFIARCEDNGALLRKMRKYQPRACSGRQALLDRLAWAGWGLAAAWALGRVLLPVVESLPSAPGARILRAIHDTGLAASYLAARRRGWADRKRELD